MNTTYIKDLRLPILVNKTRISSLINIITLETIKLNYPYFIQHLISVSGITEHALKTAEADEDLAAFILMCIADFKETASRNDAHNMIKFLGNKGWLSNHWFDRNADSKTGQKRPRYKAMVDNAFRQSGVYIPTFVWADATVVTALHVTNNPSKYPLNNVRVLPTINNNHQFNTIYNAKQTPIANLTKFIDYVVNNQSPNKELPLKNDILKKTNKIVSTNNSDVLKEAAIVLSFLLVFTQYSMFTQYEIVGTEYELIDVDGNKFFIDLLLFNKGTKKYYIIEFKRANISHHAVGQLAFYTHLFKKSVKLSACVINTCLIGATITPEMKEFADDLLSANSVLLFNEEDGVVVFNPRPL